MALTTDRKTPGLIGILFGAGLSVVLGGLLALVFFILKPVEVVRTMPKEPADGVRYFVEGASGSGGRATWERKVDLVAAGGGATSFTEAEMNAWSEETFETAKVDEASKADSAMIIAGKPNFRIAGDKLQLGLINDVVVLGLEQKLVLQAQGSFVRKGGGWAFEPTEFFLGGLPLHKLPMVASLVAKRFSPATELPAAVAKVLNQASSIVVGEEMVTVTMP